MAQENIKLFMEKLAESDELKAKLKAAEEAYTGDKTDKEKAVNEIIIPLSNEVGLPFTIDELKAAEEAMSAEEELGEDELNAVAGGKYGGCVIIGLGYKGKGGTCFIMGSSTSHGFCFAVGLL